MITYQKTIKLIASFLIAVCITQTAVSQEKNIHKLDLDKSIAIAKEQSYTILKLREALKSSEYQLKAATSSFKTHINMDLTAPNYSEAITAYQDESGLTYFSDKQLSYSGKLTINQPLPTDGNIFVSSGFFNTDDYDQDEKLFRLSTRVGLTQPIQSLYAYNSIKSEFKKAKLNYDLTRKRFKRNELDLIYNVSKAFYDLHSSRERLNITRRSMDRQKEAYTIAQNKYQAGLIREVEALQMEVDLGDAKNKHDMASVMYSSQLNYFKQILGLPLTDSVILTSNFSYQPIEINIKKAIQKGLENRLELKEKQLMIDLANIDIKRIKARGTMSGNISAYYDFIGLNKYDIDIPIRTAMRNSWSNLKDRPGNFGVALNLKIPILDWGENRSRVKAAQAKIKQSILDKEEETIEIKRQIISTVSHLYSSLRRLQLLEKNMEVAEKSFAISQKRYSNGDIDSQALALDRERLDNSHISHLEAYISYKLLLADLKQKTFYDFENNKDLFL